MFALDANADGSLANAEIANAAASLRALDGTGRLTAGLDSFRQFTLGGRSRGAF